MEIEEKLQLTTHVPGWKEQLILKAREAALEKPAVAASQLLAAHLSPQAVDYREVDYTRPTTILLGNERRGVSDAAAAAADRHIVIPMLGMVRSLNVSVATAVIRPPMFAGPMHRHSSAPSRSVLRRSFAGGAPSSSEKAEEPRSVKRVQTRIADRTGVRTSASCHEGEPPFHTALRGWSILAGQRLPPPKSLG